MERAAPAGRSQLSRSSLQIAMPVLMEPCFEGIVVLVSIADESKSSVDEYTAEVKRSHHS